MPDKIVKLIEVLPDGKTLTGGYFKELHTFPNGNVALVPHPWRTSAITIIDPNKVACYKPVTMHEVTTKPEASPSFWKNTKQYLEGPSL